MIKINLIEYFEGTVKKYADKVAVWDKERHVTFAGLKNYSKALAWKIVQDKGIIKKPIAVYLNKSIESVYADMAIIYSGNFYMNLDVKTPAERIKNILELIQPAAIISNSQFEKNIKDVIPAGIDVINLDSVIWEDIECDDKTLLRRLEALIDTDPLCIINTSGSTGTPKGVVLNHRSFFDFTEWAQEEFGFTDYEVIGSLSPLVFDIYSYELCLLMSRGSTMVLIPDNLSAFPVTILKLLQEKKVSFIFWVPTIMVNIANMDLLSQMQLPDLKLCWFAGEVFPTKQFNYWHHKLPHVLFANLYGPIEITLDCTYFKVERELKDEEPIPIGFPCRNTDILILNENNQQVSEKQKEGELCVRGTSLAMGYYNNPEKTAAAFVQNPLNKAYPEIIYRTGDIVFINELGEIVFKGRKDSLVKHLGYRIELGEIEHVIINKLKLVKNGCVVYSFARKEITLFYEAEKELTAAEFRLAIGKELPKYMIPTVYHCLEQLKRNTNGKIDRLYYSKQVND
ncbi:AMP-binding protein [Culturomica massiliensis]|jgi:amino acid adenylation domain-containing protein|uniref:AMP-binding protein n=1 Tax=Culturomica massiliensis TaxID=1841857 RepID=UPI001D0C0BC9|nr:MULTISPECIES: AMP-binding protein [Odoribacteraceae]